MRDAGAGISIAPPTSDPVARSSSSNSEPALPTGHAVSNTCISIEYQHNGNLQDIGPRSSYEFLEGAPTATGRIEENGRAGRLLHRGRTPTSAPTRPRVLLFHGGCTPILVDLLTWVCLEPGAQRLANAPISLAPGSEFRSTPTTKALRIRISRSLQGPNDADAKTPSAQRPRGSLAPSNAETAGAVQGDRSAPTPQSPRLSSGPAPLHGRFKLAPKRKNSCTKHLEAATDRCEHPDGRLEIIRRLQ